MSALMRVEREVAIAEVEDEALSSSALVAGALVVGECDDITYSCGCCHLSGTFQIFPCNLHEQFMVTLRGDELGNCVRSDYACGCSFSITRYGLRIEIMCVSHAVIK